MEACELMRDWIQRFAQKIRLLCHLQHIFLGTKPNQLPNSGAFLYSYLVPVIFMVMLLVVQSESCISSSSGIMYI
jgi:hypothetical protein